MLCFLVDCTDKCIQDDGVECKSTSKDELPYLSQESLGQTIYLLMVYGVSQSTGLTRQPLFTTRVKRIVISVYLNSVFFNFVY